MIKVNHFSEKYHVFTNKLLNTIPIYNLIFAIFQSPIFKNGVINGNYYIFIYRNNLICHFGHQRRVHELISTP